MAAFTSGTQALQGRTVNHDKRPYYHVGTRYAGQSPHGYTTRLYDPRPEFTVHDNPILAAYRNQGWLSPEHAIGALHALAMFGGYSDWNDPRHPHHALTVATEEQAEHALRVLEKLAALA